MKRLKNGTRVNNVRPGYPGYKDPNALVMPKRQPRVRQPTPAEEIAGVTPRAQRWLGATFRRLMMIIREGKPNEAIAAAKVLHDLIGVWKTMGGNGPTIDVGGKQDGKSIKDLFEQFGSEPNDIANNDAGGAPGGVGVGAGQAGSDGEGEVAGAVGGSGDSDARPSVESGESAPIPSPVGGH